MAEGQLIWPARLYAIRHGDIGARSAPGYESLTGDTLVEWTA